MVIKNIDGPKILTQSLSYETVLLRVTVLEKRGYSLVVPSQNPSGIKSENCTFSKKAMLGKSIGFKCDY